MPYSATAVPATVPNSSPTTTRGTVNLKEGDIEVDEVEMCTLWLSSAVTYAHTQWIRRNGRETSVQRDNKFEKIMQIQNGNMFSGGNAVSVQVCSIHFISSIDSRIVLKIQLHIFTTDSKLTMQ